MIAIYRELQVALKFHLFEPVDHRLDRQRDVRRRHYPLRYLFHDALAHWLVQCSLPLDSQGIYTDPIA